MIQPATGTIVRKTISVDAPQERAFKIFTEGMDTWWPREGKSIGAQPLEAAVLEPRAGGRWYERDVDGSECDWGRVLTWDPPKRIVLAWQINGEWAYDPDFVTEVEVRFIAEGANRTRVELEHRDLERFGDQAETIRRAFDSPDGWTGLLENFAQAAPAPAA